MNRNINPVVLLTLALTVAFARDSDAQVFDYRGPDNGMVSNKFEGVLRGSTSYRLYVPPSANGPLRGTITWSCNNEGDDRRYANDPTWQAFATEMRMALMGTENKLGSATANPFWKWQHDNHCSMAASVTDAVAQLGIMAGHPELARLPLTISGGSAGANFAVNMVGHLPERFICAAVTISEFGFGRDIQDNGRKGFPPQWGVPMFVTSGLGEQTKTAITRAYSSYALGQKNSAPWTLAMHPTKGHNRIGEDVIRTFLRAYINLRLSPDFKPGQKLNPIDLRKGWLGDPKSYAVASYNNYPGDKKAAMWLPDETTAMAWKKFLTHP